MKTPLQQAEELFHRALDLPATERAAFLANASAGQAELHAQVEALLQAHERGGGFLPTEAGGPAVIAIPPESPAMEAGQVIGRYKLLQKIGEGGCGVVFVAEQAEPVRRRVALKIIKLGMDTRQVIARFEAERQALALMDHPNIAKVLDGGATENGRPYFVMELVRGVPITDYCDQACLTTVQRIDLFIQVCQAVQHAHQKGIIHRDLKPSNILVTVNDGIAVPKVIDFGIAKATAGQPLTDKTVFTAFEQFIGTPAYMSPEQALMTSLDIDTRSDIYALGVLLYELLTGRTPFDARALLTAGLDELRRTILETDPARPSARLSSLAQGELTTAAKRRATVAPRLIHSMQGDLDWIVMKCLEKDRSRRYETANGLAADLQRHLANEPVVARPPSAAYRLQKAVHRNKAAFTAVGAIAFSLVLGLGLAIWQAIEKSRAYTRAVAAETAARVEAAKSRQVADLFRKMFGGMKHSVALGRDTTVLREIAEKTLAELGQKQDVPPEVDAELRVCLAMNFHVTGEYLKAEALYRETLPRMRALMSQESLDVTAAVRDYACVLHHVGKFNEAEAAAREALKRSRESEDPESEAVADSLGMLSIVFLAQNRLAEAEQSAREAVELHVKASGPENSNTAAAITHHAVLLGKLGRHVEAEPLFVQGLTVARMLFPEVHPAVASALEKYANDLFGQLKLAEASERYRQLLPIQRKLFGNEDHRVATTLLNISATLIDDGHPVEGEPFARECLAIQEKLHGPKHPDVVAPMINLGVSLRLQGRAAEAERMSREALRIATLPSPDYASISGILVNLGLALADQTRWQEMDALFENALARGFGNAAQADILATRGAIWAGAKNWRKAAADFARALELEPANHMHYHNLAPVLVQNSDLEGYRQHCRREIAQFRDTKDPHAAERMAKDCLFDPRSQGDLAVVAAWAELAVTAGNLSPDLAWFQSTQGLAEYRLGRFREAVAWVERALQRTGEAHRDLQATALLALARHQLGEAAAARSALNQAEAIHRNLPRVNRADHSDSWLERLIAQALLSEAGRAIGGPSAVAAPAGQGTSESREARP